MPFAIDRRHEHWTVADDFDVYPRYSGTSVTNIAECFYSSTVTVKNERAQTILFLFL